jgi:hypothetical protein
MYYIYTKMCDLEQVFFIRFGLSAVVHTPVPEIAGPIRFRDDIPCYARNLPACSNRQLNYSDIIIADKGALMSTKGFLLK